MVFPHLVLDDRRAKSNGTYPIVIRVTHNRRTAAFPVGISVKKEHWDEHNCTLLKSHPNYKSLHTAINNAYHKVQKSTEELLNNQQFTLKALKEKIRVQPVIEVEATKLLTFNEYANRLINDLYQNNKVGNAIVYQTAVNRLISFANFTELTFEQVNYRLLENFKNKLVSDGVKPNTVSNYFRTLRAIFNKAIKEKLVSRDAYYFTDIAFKPERTAKRSISKEAVIKFVNYSPETSKQECNAKDYFILSFSLIGISFTDLAYLKPSNIKAGRLVYKRRKTGRTYDIKLTTSAVAILKNFEDVTSGYLLPILPKAIKEDSLQAKNIILQWIKTTNKYLKKISGNLKIGKVTTYVARHTWATLAKRMGYSNELIAEAMGHQYGNRTTAIYLDDFEQHVIDNLNSAIQEFVTKANDSFLKVGR
ncbi:tyrosine-type recombinase/integrase [Mucilaginibacter pallidiroseus]|uniref:Tyrosine-type recombinase/integrase n=1 Tax=Mucilaginibacter pallidiroseus TaxID=2599295 RepID=A0A563UGJ0_9SPHI|nr:site-specific integrase [Mucilaginibacter pallidiroseus]TWR30461.1 tyrosine-type recombinase/integrase [Mucilaginibacter pallidiroseus]